MSDKLKEIKTRLVSTVHFPPQSTQFFAWWFLHCTINFKNTVVNTANGLSPEAQVRAPLIMIVTCCGMLLIHVADVWAT